MKSQVKDLLEKHREGFERFAELLREHNKVMNLTRLDSPEEIWVRHFEDSLAAVPVLRELEVRSLGRRLIDIGSGAGLPGLALAMVMPDWEFVSIEATGKKVEFQLEVIERLGLKNARVMNSRAELLAHDRDYRGRFTAAAARAMGHFRLMAEVILPFVKVGGDFLAWKGQKADLELPESLDAIRKCGGKIHEQRQYRLTGIDESDFRIVIIRKVKDTPNLFPREYKLIKSRPL